MSIRTAQELKHARGMVERRQDLAEVIGSANSRRHAEDIFRSLCGAVKEVSKHRKNIFDEIDNESASHAIEVQNLLDMVTAWKERSSVELAGWGATEEEILSIERGVFAQ